MTGRPAILALDTSARDAHVGLLLGDAIEIAEVDRSGGRHARKLVPTVDALLERHALKPVDLTGVVVNLGPGSFTGLRVGITVAQTLGWLTGVPLVGVGLFERLAHQTASQSDRPRVFVANAEREELFIATAAVGKSTASPTQIVPAASLGDLACDAAVFGSLPARVDCGLPPDRIQTPAVDPVTALLQLGRTKLDEGQTTSPAQLLPVYGRRSAAEELRDAGRRPNYAR